MFGKKEQPMALDYNYHKDSGLMVFKVDFDSVHVTELEKDINKILSLAQSNPNNEITLDFELVKEMDTSGFAFIVALIYRLSKLNIKVHLTHLHRLTAFAKLYDLEDYIEQFLVKTPVH